MSEDNQFEKDAPGSKKKNNGPKPGAKAKPAAAQSEHDSAEELDEPNQTISLFLAVSLIVSALVVGLVVGYVVAPKSAVNDFGGTAPTGSAPALTPDQLNSNQLPPSHPPLPDGGASSTGAPAGGEGGNASETPAP